MLPVIVPKGDIILPDRTFKLEPLGIVIEPVTINEPEIVPKNVLAVIFPNGTFILPLKTVKSLPLESVVAANVEDEAVWKPLPVIKLPVMFPEEYKPLANI